MAPWNEIERLASDRTMGAAETADRAARVLPAIPREELVDAIEALLAGHPCMAPLWRLVPPTFTDKLKMDIAALTLEQPHDGSHKADRRYA